ncbi:MAG: hypothetical protein AAGJ10_15765 [Bacteroidota bacterium]
MEPSNNAPQQLQKRVPLGKAIQLPDDLNDLPLGITPDDVRSAQANWRETAPPEARDLLDAEDDQAES